MSMTDAGYGVDSGTAPVFSTGEPSDAERTLSCIDAFCGPGGLSLGLADAGFHIRAAFDLDKNSVETYRRNIGDHSFAADARRVTGEALRSLAGMGADEELDLLAGGPPCQGFSKQKRGAHLGDPRNELVLEFLRLIRELRPRAFGLEPFCSRTFRSSLR